MMTKEQINRINELARLSKQTDLTTEELSEQTILRKLYIESIKTNLKDTLDHMDIQQPDGSVICLIDQKHNK